MNKNLIKDEAQHKSIINGDRSRENAKMVNADSKTVLKQAIREENQVISSINSNPYVEESSTETKKDAGTPIKSSRYTSNALSTSFNVSSRYHFQSRNSSAGRNAGTATNGAEKEVKPSRIGNYLKSTAVRKVEDLKADEEDNLGIQGTVKTKDAVFKVNKTIKGAREMSKFIATPAQRVHKNTRTTVKAINMVRRKAQQTAAAVKAFIKSPMVVKTSLLVAGGCVLLLFVLLSFPPLPSIIGATTFATEDEDLTEIFLYITKKDTDVELDFLNFEKAEAFEDIDSENVTKIKNVEPYSDAYMFVDYLMAKYQDQVTLNDLKSEIDDIFEKLYQISYSVTEEERIEQELLVDMDGKPILSPDGEEQYIDVVTIVKCLEVTLDGEKFEDYFEARKESMLDTKQLGVFDMYQTIGGTAFKASLQNPFDSSWTLSSRYGWRVNPTLEGDNGEALPEKHAGLDIPMPNGTPILACMSGTVEAHMGHSMYGNYVVIKKGKEETRYAHCASLAVSTGQTVKRGDVIAYVGSTGNSTGNHLHLEYYYDRKNLNPYYYLEKEND